MQPGCLLSPRRSKYEQPRDRRGSPRWEMEVQGCVPLPWSHLCVPNLPSPVQPSSAPGVMQTKKTTGKTHPPRLQSSQTGSSHFLGLEHKLRSGKLGPQVSDCLFRAPRSISARRRCRSLCLPARPLLSASLSASQVLAALPAPQHPDNSVFKTLIIIKPCYFSSSCRIS